MVGELVSDVGALVLTAAVGAAVEIGRTVGAIVGLTANNPVFRSRWKCEFDFIRFQATNNR